VGKTSFAEGGGGINIVFRSNYRPLYLYEKVFCALVSTQQECDSASSRKIRRFESFVTDGGESRFGAENKRGGQEDDIKYPQGVCERAL
jgi:hypothetical protein